MKWQRTLVVLTVVNTLMLVFNVSQRWPVSAQGTPSILRGSGLEIVDAQGRKRASIEILAPSRGPDGSAYPETVILRLIDQRGKPKVKLATSDRSTGLGMVGDTDTVQALIEADGTEARVKLQNSKAKQQIVQP